MRFLLILIAFLAIQNLSKSQNYYIPLDNASGIIMAPEQETELETAIAQIIDLLDPTHQPRFKVYDFGYYIHNEPMGEVPARWTTVTTEVENDPNSDYYLIFGRESSNEGMNNHVRVKLKLPQDLGFECMTADMRTNIEKYVEVAANETGSLAVFGDELAAVNILHEYVYKILVCGCNGLAKPTGCSTTKSFAQIDIELRALGFRKKEITLGGASGWPSGQNGIYDYAQKKVVIDGTEYNIAQQVAAGKAIFDASVQVFEDTSISTSMSGEVYILEDSSFHNGKWEEALLKAIELNYVEYWVILTNDLGKSFLYSRYTFGPLSSATGPAKPDSISGKLQVTLSPWGLALKALGNAALDACIQAIFARFTKTDTWAAAWKEVSVIGAFWEGLSSLLPWEKDLTTTAGRAAASALVVVCENCQKYPDYTVNQGLTDFTFAFGASALTQLLSPKFDQYGRIVLMKGIKKVCKVESPFLRRVLMPVQRNILNGGGNFVKKYEKYERREYAEIFYRTIPNDHYDALKNTFKLLGTSETSTSPNLAFVQGYSGTIVKFYVEPGTIEKLVKVGRSAEPQLHPLIRNNFGNMEHGSSGWGSQYARFKVEKNPAVNNNTPQVNIQLGTGTGLNIFNQGLLYFEKL